MVGLAKMTAVGLILKPSIQVLGLAKKGASVGLCKNDSSVFAKPSIQVLDWYRSSFFSLLHFKCPIPKCKYLKFNLNIKPINY